MKITDYILEEFIHHYLVMSKKNGIITFNFDGKTEDIILRGKLKNLENRCQKDGNFEPFTNELHIINHKIQNEIFKTKEKIKYDKSQYKFLRDRKANALIPTKEVYLHYDDVIKIALGVIRGRI